MALVGCRAEWLGPAGILKRVPCYAQDREEEKLCRAVKRLHTTSENQETSTESSEVRSCDLSPHGMMHFCHALIALL